jgi:transcriptional regulator with XRE-family HTH domain
MDKNKLNEARRDAVRRFMAAHNLTPASWAREAGVSSSAIYNFLNGAAASLSQPTLEKLAASARASIAEVMGGETSSPGLSARRLRLQIDQDVSPDQAARIYKILDETP